MGITEHVGKGAVRFSLSPTTTADEIRRGGQLLFVEHGLAPEDTVERWQHRLTPLWKKLGGGCHLNRSIRALIEGAGFGIANLNMGYMKGPKPMTFLYEGRAKPL